MTQFQELQRHRGTVPLFVCLKTALEAPGRVGQQGFRFADAVRVSVQRTRRQRWLAARRARPRSLRRRRKRGIVAQVAMQTPSGRRRAGFGRSAAGAARDRPGSAAAARGAARDTGPAAMALGGCGSEGLTSGA